ncbi:MAG: hypothetical protein DLM52_07745 [Chthoniobacterales bacterium]|nr:MAG: hypothetical protein DLM52_07745 [Chthoniobacterales bacterium]
MLNLTHLKEWAWETEYLSEISSLIPEINGVVVHWRSERLFRRRFARFRPKFLREKLSLPRNIAQESVLIILSDELYRTPPKAPGLVVFKQYVGEEDDDSFPFPLGYRRGFPKLAPLPMESRTIDVGFRGRMYPHRQAFLTQLANHPKLREFRIDLTSETRLSVAEYAGFLNNCRISLCLAGNSSPETFRYYESLKTGCIVVTPRMPRNALYQCHPGFEMSDIDDVERVAEALRRILEAPAEHAALQQRALQTWETQYAPAAVAALLRDTVDLRAAARVA